MDPEALDGRGSRKHSDSKLEFIYGSKSNMGYGQIDVIDGTGSLFPPDRRLSSSLRSSEDDFFEVNRVKVTKSRDSILGLKDEEDDVSSESSAKSEVDNISSCPMSTSQVYDVTHDQHKMVMSQTSTPPFQVMNRSAGYDPDRIPSSIFDRNTTPADWSIASNDSLFSIHLENNSFSRDHLFTWSDVGNSKALTKSGELNVFSSAPSAIVEETDTPRKSVEKENMQTTDILDEAFEIEERIGGDRFEVKSLPPAVSCNSSNVSTYSHGSGTSAHSFAFPILTEAEKYSSVKTHIPQQKSVENATEVTSSSSATCCNWFRCFSWSCCTWGRYCRCC